MRILLTRPAEDAEALAQRLQERGHAVILAPLLSIEMMAGPELDLSGVAGVILTSANGARALGRRTAQRDAPVFAVGDATARAARMLGFADVRAADGDVTALAALIRREMPANAGRLLHIAGTVTAGDLAADLATSGYDVVRRVVYEAKAASALPEAAVQALKAGGVDAALFYSPRTARTFATLARQAGLTEESGGVVAGALSDAVADALQSLPWRRIVVAEKPTEAALLAALGIKIEGQA